MVRELARLTRDLMVVKIDASRASDPEIAAEGQERTRIVALAPRFSSEDLMRAFEVLTKAEYEIRGSAQPRYHLEMALLRWIHLRKLVPLSDLIQGLEKGGPVVRTGPTGMGSSRTVGAAAPAATARPVSPPARPSIAAATVKAVETRREAAARPAPVAAPAAQPVAPGQRRKRSWKSGRQEVLPRHRRRDGPEDRAGRRHDPVHVRTAYKALRIQLDQKRSESRKWHRAWPAVGSRSVREGLPTASSARPGWSERAAPTNARPS